MRRREFLAAAGTMLALPSWAAADPILEKAQSMLPWLVEQRRDFHRHPELMYQEVRTAKVVADRLAKLGLDEIRTGIGKTGVTALVRGAKPGPCIALRADMDALPIDESAQDIPYKSTKPGVKHACGHDAHTTMLLGAAEILQSMRGDLAGTIKVVFQPAEEGGRGAEAMIQDGVLENPKVEAIFGQHVWPAAATGDLEWCPGAFMASGDFFTIKIQGKNAHGARPEDGIDAVVIAAEAISALQTIRSRRIATSEPMVLTVGSIHGGTAPNIIAGEVELTGTLRTLSANVRDQAVTMMHQTLKGVVAAFGGSYTLDVKGIGTVTYNEPKLVDRTVPAFTRLLGESRVRRIGPQMVAEDFSYYQKVIPGFFYYLGIRNEKTGLGVHALHTPEFDLDEAAMPCGVAALVHAARNYLAGGSR
jgi:amidohydrolase